MTNMGVVVSGTLVGRVAGDQRTGRRLQNRPAVPGPWVYVETGDPDLDNGFSPEWESDIYFVADAPIAFRHGLDGQLDMTGQYDLSLGAVTGDLAFILPAKWRRSVNGFLATFFPLEVDTDVWSAAVQTINGTNGHVRIYWPIVADPMP